MSKDYNVFLKNADNISAADFEAFAFSLGYFIRVFPASNYKEHIGFLPFNIYLNFIDRPLPYDSFVSGFETYFWKYNAQEAGPEFDRLVESSKDVLLISFSGEDSLQELTALLWARYLCEFCGGILYDPQTDVLFSNVSVINDLINEQRLELIKLSDRGSLKLHEFTQWN